MIFTEKGLSHGKLQTTKQLCFDRYKGIAMSLTILTRALVGNYVNFGVFALYGDSALADALDVTFKLTLSIPLKDVSVSPTHFALP